MQNDSSNSQPHARRRAFLRDFAAASVGVGAFGPGLASANANDGGSGSGSLRIDNPSYVDTSLASRSFNFGNPTGSVLPSR